MAGNVIDWLGGVITAPVRTLNEIAREKPVAWALLIYFGVTALSSVSSLYDGQTHDELKELMFMLNINIALPLQLLYSIFLSGLLLFIFTAVMHLFARLFKGSGGYWNFFSAYAFANFPMILTVPVAFLTGFIGAAGMVINGLVVFAVSIWVICLQVLALRESYGLTTGKSILVFLIPLVLVIVAAFAIVFFVIVALFAGF